MIIGRFREDENDWTPLERRIRDAVLDVLRSEGTLDEETGRFVLHKLDGTSHWIEFEVAESPVVEPAPGTTVEAPVEGVTRQGVVTWRGPGCFAFDFHYKKSGIRSTAVVHRTQPYRVLETK